jgi:hypothetical protein
MSEDFDAEEFGPCGEQDDVARLVDQIEALTWDLERNGSPGSRWEKAVARQQLRLRLAAALRDAQGSRPSRRLTAPRPAS